MNWESLFQVWDQVRDVGGPSSAAQSSCQSSGGETGQVGVGVGGHGGPLPFHHYGVGIAGEQHVLIRICSCNSPYHR